MTKRALTQFARAANAFPQVRTTGKIDAGDSGERTGMAKIFWRGSKSGDWANVHNWYSAVPVDDDTAYIRGSNFTVTLSTEQRVGHVNISGAGVVLDIVRGGSLQMYAQYALTLTNGAALHVTGKNVDFGATGRFYDSTVLFANGSALGDGDLNFVRSTLEVSGRVRLGNVVYFDDPVGEDADTNRILVATGGTLTFGVHASFDNGIVIGDAQHTGTIVLSSVDARYGGTVEIAGGTLKLAPGIAGPANPFYFNRLNFRIDAGAKFDMGGNAVDLMPFEGSGAIVNSGPVAQLQLLSNVKPYQMGSISGAVILTVPEYDQNVNSPYGGHITLNAAVSLSGGGGVRLGAADLTMLGSFTTTRTTSITVQDGPSQAFGGYLDLRSTFAIAGEINLFGDSALNLYGSGTISGDVTGSIIPGRFEPILGIDSAGDITISGRISNVYLLKLGTGVLTLSHDNSQNGLTHFDLGKGVVKLAAVGAIGDVDVGFSGGTIVSTVSQQLANLMIFYGSATIAAARGKTLDLTGDLLVYDADGTLILGTRANDGTIVFSFNGTQDAGTGGHLAIAAGTVALGQTGGVQRALSMYATVGVAAGATLDLRGVSAALTGLAGGGAVTSATAATLTLMGSDFGGVITGRTLAVDIVANPGADYSPVTTFTGRSTYGGGTHIGPGAALALADGGTVAGKIVNDGALFLSKSASFTLVNPVSGSGALAHDGTGTTRINGANTYAGGTYLYDGTIAIGSAAALGTGSVWIDGGTLITSAGGIIGDGSLHLADGAIRFTAAVTLGGTIYTGASSMVAAAHGITATIASGLVIDDVSSGLIFGSSAADGTIPLAPGDLVTQANAFFVAVEGGTLVLGNFIAGQVIGKAAFVDVDAGATLDIKGLDVTARELQLDGAIVNSGAEHTLSIHGGYSNGTISGPIQVLLFSDFVFGGTGTFSSLDIEDAFTVTFEAANSATIYLDAPNIALVLAPAASLSGHIAGFTTGDTIALEGIAYSAATKLTYTAATHVLKVSDGTNSVSLTFDGRYSKANFTLADDGEGHAVISYAPGAPRAHRFDHVDTSAFGGDAASVGHHHHAAPAADILLVG